MLIAARTFSARRLRREYLDKDENKGALPPRGCCHQDGSDFTFGGHRLSSLYRMYETCRSRLTSGCPALISSLYKYSKPTFAPQTTLGVTGT